MSDLKVLAPTELLRPELAAGAPGAAKSKEAAQQFEGMLMAQVFQALRKTIEPSGLFGDGGQARQTYDYLLDQAVVAHAMQSGKGWGLAERLQEQWNQTNRAQDLKESGKLPIEPMSR